MGWGDRRALGAVMDVAVWLRSLGLEQYEAAFRENEISEQALPSLTAEDLKEIGVGPVGHRRTLLEAIAALRADASTKVPSSEVSPQSSTASAHPEDRAERRQVTDASNETEVARLKRKLREAREQQAATSEVLQIVSSSPGDLQPVFAAMLEKAVRICDAKFGNIHRWDGEALHLLAAHNTPADFAEVRSRSPFRVGPQTPTGRMLATKTVVHITDLAADAAYIEEGFQ